MSKPVTFNNTVLRDGHQSLAATRMATEQMLPLLEPLDSLGYAALETWGGATIDSGLRFLKEFPFKRLDAIRAKTKTPHMMLLRGQNIVAYDQNPDDVVTAFVQKSIAHGMNILRIFDALNDTRNMQTAIAATKKAGGHAQGTICYTKSPVHTIEGFVKMGAELAAMGCDSICIKDMAGLIPPYIASAIIKGLKAQIKIPVILHTHETAGLGSAAYLAAIEAGVDTIDVGIRPFADGTAQPDHLRMTALLENAPRKAADYDLKKVREISEALKPVYAQLSKFTRHANEVVDTDAITYEVPGGMLSNFRSQLTEMKMEDRFDEVFAEIPYVREKLGWIPLVTPTSQIVGTQAVMNVKFGRWKNFIPGAMNIALGYFGRTPAPVDPEIQKLAAATAKKDPITCRPADLIKPRMETLRAELAQNKLPTDDEHCVIYAMFPQQLKELYAQPAPAAPVAAPTAPAPAAKASAPAPAPAAESGTAGNVLKYAMTIGDRRVEATVEEIS
ncbi:pyruvate carboxylase subunit B [Ereboglobus luteus]|uniref:Pyruvate carboxyltransferase n=1 Tax=Ereboglobus luteus TaxID=1796921 RepID=A0A2U8E5X6_9BACT|nr:pyruvate carboxylase subunit B [Ereboglobus luteus]AWI09932.1 pyruvate carboxyltransferase [Ereboglobus luteus]